ncbi:hypothetical protein MUB24_15080 [Lederbergia sp. NSJ-179]|uniref:hypothetical protein n=1 Tax=Lederbergia sp. NSJ-179 TaxID=2931402 RepID=UPI001FD1FCBF|nr:hypothetical protein [Lederbergia sp. NSJ-179]MCJ7842202.1 hypothetical protein [Lederbergia sp. NSJ-179]
MKDSAKEVKKMMEWMLAILLGTAVVLLILSFVKTRQTSTKMEREMDQLSLTFTDELYKVQQQIRLVEIDGFITAQEAGALPISSEQRVLLREVIDLYKRGYSIKNIAAKKGCSQQEMEQLLAPYMDVKEGEKSNHVGKINA